MAETTGSKLVILRGPSGAGKSTVAHALQEQSGRGIALIEQDYFREVMFYGEHKKASKEAHREMITANVIIALRHGFDVILEGILSKDSYADHFQQIFTEHQEENYMFYFDVSFDETMRRHATRSKAEDFGEDSMRGWYPIAAPLQYPNEEIIPEAFTLDQSVARIREVTGL